MAILFFAAVDVPLVDLQLLPDVAIFAQDELLQQAQLLRYGVGPHSLRNHFELFGVGKAGLEVAVRVFKAV